MTSPFWERIDADVLVRFGVIADTQHADVDWDGSTRYYRAALHRLSEAVATFNDQDLAFVLCLGDMVDRAVKDWPAVAAVLGHLRVPVHHILGNHDLEATAGSRDLAMSLMGMPAAWQSWAVGNVRFLALDTNEASALELPHGSPERAAELERISALAASGMVNAHPWNGGVGAEQLSWLDDELTRATGCGEEVIVVGHHPLWPPTDHTALNADEVLAVLGPYGNVRAVFSGHHHVGNYAAREGVHYLTYAGMVETEVSAYAVVEVTRDAVRVRGFGREPDRDLRRS